VQASGQRRGKGDNQIGDDKKNYSLKVKISPNGEEGRYFDQNNRSGGHSRFRGGDYKKGRDPEEEDEPGVNQLEKEEGSRSIPQSKLSSESKKHQPREDTGKVQAGG